MLRSMFTAIGALTLHQTYMDVVADNLANVNTHGFKSGRFSFQSQIAQLMQSGAAPTATTGGLNPMQVGLGVRAGGAGYNFTQGTLQGTNRLTDLAIQGDGLFVYRDSTNGTQFYSRDGAIDVDADGYLVNLSNGMRVQGWVAQNGVVDTGTALSSIDIPLNSTMAEATTTALVRGNLNAAATSGSAGAATSTLGVYDSLGNLHDVSITFTPAGNGVWNWAATSGSPAASVGTGSTTFDSTGHYVSGTGTLTIPGLNGANTISVTLDMSNLTQLASGSTIALASQDGVGPGSLSGFHATALGEIYGVYSNGLQQLIGQLATATFVNNSGLERAGQNMFIEGLNSGDPNFAPAGSSGHGTFVTGYLEASNVDMAQEFTNMILAQRGFQASSRVITTSDEMLQELVNLKR